MQWTTPTYAEVKMDAEIGSYQEDTEPTRECPFVSAEAADASAALGAGLAAA
jgi:hypothetical protein